METGHAAADDTEGSYAEASYDTYTEAAAPPTAEVALAHLDEAATALQREGRFLEALECMERGLVLRQRYYGVRSAEVNGEPPIVEGMYDAWVAERPCQLSVLSIMQGGWGAL